MKNVELGKAIRVTREMRCMSVTEAAETANMTIQNWCDIERGYRSCGNRILSKVAASLGTTPGILKLRADLEKDQYYQLRKKDPRIDAIAKQFLKVALTFEEALAGRKC
jgi:transcriptional regulator with XRE-family HTH domain